MIVYVISNLIIQSRFYYKITKRSSCIYLFLFIIIFLHRLRFLHHNFKPQMVLMKFNEIENFELDTDNLPLGENFKTMLAIFGEYNVSSRQQLSIGMEYYHQNLEEEFVTLIKNLIKETSFDETECEYIITLYNAYLIKNKQTPKFVGSFEVTDMLKGIQSLRNNDIASAKRFFKKAKFTLGIEMTNYIANEKANLLRNQTLKVLIDYKNSTKSLKTNVEINKYVKYRIDPLFRKEQNLEDLEKIEKYLLRNENGELKHWYKNIDVLLELADFYIRNPEIFNLIMTKIDDECSGKNFLWGKYHHIKKEYTEAAEYYKRSNSILAKYNLMRIEQKEIIPLQFVSEKKDNFIVYLSKKLKTPVRINCEMTDYYEAVNNPSLYTYRKLIGNSTVSQCIVMNNIVYYAWVELEKYKSKYFKFIKCEEANNDTLVLSLSERNSDYKNCYSNILKQYKMCIDMINGMITETRSDIRAALEENINILTNDLSTFVTNGNAYLDLDLERARKSGESNILGYYYLLAHDYDKASNILSKDSLVIGYILIQKYYETQNEANLHKAFEQLKKSSSVYAINLISIVLIHLKRYGEAKIILKALVNELPLANINMGNLSILLNNYSEALFYFKRAPLTDYTCEMLKVLAVHNNEKDLPNELLRYHK